jgi:hypothetical protein
MKAVELLERPVLSDEVANTPDELAYALNSAGGDQDGMTRDWTMQTCGRATQMTTP